MKAGVVEVRQIASLIDEEELVTATIQHDSDARKRRQTMNGAGASIYDALKKFTANVFPLIESEVRDSTEEDMKWSCWMAQTYPETLAALARLPDFSGNKGMADAYICGYYRGLSRAAWLLSPRSGPKRLKNRKEAS